MEPLISVIIPIYKVELYLRHCLNSVLGQSYRNLEIILVDDGSPDNCGEICDEYAAKDSRVKVIHKPNGGVSDARNAGLAIASGDYVGFVDSDDWIAPDMYEYLYRGMVDYDADVTLCEYYECWPKKRFATNRDGVRLFEGREVMDALLQLKIGNYAWNKLYKRSLWSEDIRYPVGKNYEDVRTTYKLLRKCGRLAALPEPKYYYRQSASSITGNHTLKNDLQRVSSRIEQFENVVDEYPENRLFMLKIIYENLGILNTTAMRVGAAEFEQYRDEMTQISTFLALHESEIIQARNLGRAGRLSLHAMAKGGYRNWKKAAKLDKLFALKKRVADKAFVKKLRNLASRLKKNLTISCFYKTYMRRPLDGNAALVESRGGDDLAGNMFFVAQEACRRGMKVYLSVRDGSMDKVERILQSGDFTGLTVVVKYTKAYYRALATSKYWFNDMVFEDLLVKRPGQVYANTWHGTPLKTLEFDVVKQRHETGGAARDFLKTDYLAVPSTFLGDILLSANRLSDLFPGKILCCGYPRNSVFFDEKARVPVRKLLGAEGKEIFVYMPTWRGSWISHTGTVGDYATDKIMEFFDSHLSDNQILLAKLHNFAVDSIDFSKYKKVRPFPTEFDTYTVLNAADCLITDYSSVFFDFANTRKKIVLFTYDKESYLSDRGLYLDLEELPFPKVSTYEELAKELDTVIRYDDTAFVERYCRYDCADSVQKLFAQVVDGKAVCETREPKSNGKKNILIYDTGFSYRLEEPAGAQELLTGLDTQAANYYYAYRQWLLKKTPGYLKNTTEGLRFYTISFYPFYTWNERIAMRLFGRIPASAVKRELNRQFGEGAFDEINVLPENQYDPYYPILHAAGGDWGK